MKKLLYTIGVALGLSFNVFATVNIVSVPTTIATNCPTLLGGGANVIQFTITSAANNVATLTVYDAPSNSYYFTNAGYSTLGSYVTNYIQLWTNYYGATNAWTNKSLVDYSNFVASNAFNLYPQMYTLTVPTNSTQTFVVNSRFNNGILVTNLGAATFTFSYQYTQ